MLKATRGIARNKPPGLVKPNAFPSNLYHTKLLPLRVGSVWRRKEGTGEGKICNSFCSPVKKFSNIWQTIKTCTKPLCSRLLLSFPPPSFACLPSLAQPECRAGMLFPLIKQQQLGNIFLNGSLAAKLAVPWEKAGFSIKPAAVFKVPNHWVRKRELDM